MMSEPFRSLLLAERRLKLPVAMAAKPIEPKSAFRCSRSLDDRCLVLAMDGLESSTCASGHLKCPDRPDVTWTGVAEDLLESPRPIDSNKAFGWARFLAKRVVLVGSSCGMEEEVA